MIQMAKGGTKIPNKIELLMQMAQLQSECFVLLQKAEFYKMSSDLNSAVIWYGRLTEASKQLLQTALFHNQHCENPVEILPIVEPLLNAMFTQADLWQSKGELQKAEALRKEALNLSQKHLGDSGIADTQRAQASALISQGRFNEALVALSASRDFFQRQGDVLQIARVTLDMADILQWLGDCSRALSELNRVATMIAPLTAKGKPTQQEVIKSVFDAVERIASGTGGGRKAQDAMQLYRISIEIDYYQGLINKALSKFEDAEKYFCKVLPEYQTMGAGPAVEYQLSSVLVGKGRHEEGLTYALRLEPIFTRKGLLRPKLAALLKVQAEALLSLGKTTEALSKLEKGLNELAIYYDPDLLWRLQWLEGRVLETMNQKDDAMRAYKQAAETINSLRKAPLGHRLDSTYLKDKLVLFEVAINLACKNGRAKECCEFMEMVKARTLAITLSMPHGKSEGSKELEKKFDALTRSLDALEYRGYRDGQTEELQKEKDLLLAERSTLLERIRFSDPRWRSLTEPVPFDLSRVSKVSEDRGHAVLSLFYRSDRVIAVLINHGKSSVASVEITPESISRFDGYRRNLQAGKPDPLLYDLSATLGVGAKHFIPTDLLSQALQSKGLIIVPHGPLHLIPWAGLIFNGKRLFEYCPVGVVPNLSSILNLNADFSTKPGVSLVGSPNYGNLSSISQLPNAEEEIKTIEKLYAGQSRLIGTVLAGKKATEKNFWEIAKHKDAEGGIFHIACHGTLEPEEPMNSGLLLTDSKVDAAEIARSSLKYDQVILSACSTGWRPTKVKDVELSGDDILGLPGAFLEAGVKSVLVSIPRADDETTYRFMTVYHQNRVRGQAPLIALQSTQKTMLSEAKYEPFKWIGFTAYGCQ